MLCPFGELTPLDPAQTIASQQEMAHQMVLEHVPRRPATRRLASIAGLSLLASLTLAAPANAQTEKVLIGITNAATDAGFFIADKKGYFRAEGIEVTMTPFASAAGMVAPLGRG